MTKEEALAIARSYGLEWEVQTWHDQFIASGMTEEQAWDEALWEWDI